MSVATNCGATGMSRPDSVRHPVRSCGVVLSLARSVQMSAGTGPCAFLWRTTSVDCTHTGTGAAAGPR